MSDPTSAVRPTRSCLSAIGAVLPNLGVRLSDVEHPLVMKAQQLPAADAQASTERIRSLTDRVWLKVKTSSWRGAAGDLSEEVEPRYGTKWWLCAGGTRQADSPQLDFYDQLSSRAHRAGPNSCSTDFLLPADWDLKRLLAEGGVNAVITVQQLVLSAAAQSLWHSDIRAFTVGDRDVRVRIRVHDDGQVYLAIGSTGSVDHTFFVTLISAIPGTGIDDWLPEPSDALEIKPEPGEIIWSTMLTVEAQAIISSHGSLDD